MEGSSTPLTQNSSTFGIGIHPNDQLPNCFLVTGWEDSLDQGDPFESALSSIVSSPVAPHAGEGEAGMIRELIGRLGSICDSGQASPGSYNHSTTNTPRYNTPLNSPPKLSLSMADQLAHGGFQAPGSHFPGHPSFMPVMADPGFAERAARFSCFGPRNVNAANLNGGLGLNASEFLGKQANKLDSGRFCRVPSSQSLRANVGSQICAQGNERSFLQPGVSTSTPENGEMGESREGSSISEQVTHGDMRANGQIDVNSRKRKAILKAKARNSAVSPQSAKDSEVPMENEEPITKKIKPAETDGNEKDAAKGDQKQSKENSKPEPQKDYIHVRARRGQATDSHSLAERVRREKISLRMKALQDLVPNCNKVTGKAMMLDEIINYVQSLQRQVELLSMKLSTLNPTVDFNLEAFLSKDILHPQGPLPNSLYPVDSSGSMLYSYQPPQGLMPMPSVVSSNMDAQFPVNFLNSGIHRDASLNLPLCVDNYGEASAPAPALWEDDLQSVVQMGLGQNEPQRVEQGSLATSQMKVEL